MYHVSCYYMLYVLEKFVLRTKNSQSGEVVSKYDLFLVKELGHGMSRGVMHLERLRNSLGGSCGEFHGAAFKAK